MVSPARRGRCSCLARCIVAIGALLLVPRASQAATITFSFQGNATGIGASNMDPALIGVTIPFTGTFTLNDIDLNSNTSIGRYDCSGCSLPAWTLEIAGVSIVGNAAALDLTTSGQFSVNLTQAATTGFYPESFVYFGLGLGTEGLIDDALPADIPFPILTQSSRIQLYRTAGYHLYFHPVVLVPPADTAVVPEPGALVLLGTGLLMLARGVARRRAL